MVNDIRPFRKLDHPNIGFADFVAYLFKDYMHKSISIKAHIMLPHFDTHS